MRNRWPTRPEYAIVTGVLLALVSFYLFRYPGTSQVYDVVIPFAMISAYLGVGVVLQCRGELDDRSAAFYDMLPRQPEAALDAKLLWYCSQATLYLAVVLLGCVLKLGGADITPVYRLHLDIVILPYAVVLLALWLGHRPPKDTRAYEELFCFLLPSALLLLRWGLLPASADAGSNWLPPRSTPFIVEIALAGIYLGFTAWLASGIRLVFRSMREV